MKVWLLVLFLHTPEMPSIKYSAELYANDFDCIERQLQWCDCYIKQVGHHLTCLA